jgi:ATP-dependent Clp protease ATP-binding subunit ClpB
MPAAYDQVMQEVRMHFRPKLLDRLDEVFVFDPLSHEKLRKFARLKMKDLATCLVDRGIELIVTHALHEFLLTKSYDVVGGVTLYLLYCYRIHQKI